MILAARRGAGRLCTILLGATCRHPRQFGGHHVEWPEDWPEPGVCLTPAPMPPLARAPAPLHPRLAAKFPSFCSCLCSLACPDLLPLTCFSDSDSISSAGGCRVGLGKFEIYGDLCHRFDHASVDQTRPVSPALNRVHRGLGQ